MPLTRNGVEFKNNKHQLLRLPATERKRWETARERERETFENDIWNRSSNRLWCRCPASVDIVYGALDSGQYQVHRQTRFVDWPNSVFRFDNKSRAAAYNGKHTQTRIHFDGCRDDFVETKWKTSHQSDYYRSMFIIISHLDARRSANFARLFGFSWLLAVCFVPVCTLHFGVTQMCHTHTHTQRRNEYFCGCDNRRRFRKKNSITSSVGFVVSHIFCILRSHSTMTSANIRQRYALTQKIQYFLTNLLPICFGMPPIRRRIPVFNFKSNSICDIWKHDWRSTWQRLCCNYTATVCTRIMWLKWSWSFVEIENWREIQSRADHMIGSVSRNSLHSKLKYKENICSSWNRKPNLYVSNRVLARDPAKRGGCVVESRE